MISNRAQKLTLLRRPPARPMRQPFVNSKLLALQLNSPKNRKEGRKGGREEGRKEKKEKKWLGTSPNNKSRFNWGPVESLPELGGHLVAKY